MKQSSPDITAIKQKMADTWANGDFGVIAHTLMPAAEDFVNSLEIKPGEKVLDVACGSGNLAVLAAQKNADVKGIDIVDDLIRQSIERAEGNNLNIKFIVGDAEDMPYPDNEFDYVITMFGAMFCPRPDVAAKELFRVCKPGGKVAMANWTQNAFAEDFFGTVRKYAPPPPPGISPPNEWGNEEIVKQRLSSYSSDIQLTHKSFEIVYPVSPAETTEIFTRHFGPVKSIYDNMDESLRKEFTDEITAVFTKHNISNEGNNVMVGDYLEVIAIKSNE